jgi:putative hydroxymethylpyrimidine transport system substrate-binding protein
MRRIVASLAIAAAALGLAACGGDDAEPGAPREATLVLDFQPNAVHAGIYTALAEGLYEDRGVELEVRVPGSATDAPKLLEAGRAEFAVMDIFDFGIARREGARLAAIGTIVGRPLAAVIAGDRDEVRRPRDLEGGTVGVTGLPSDDAVLDAVLAADGADAGDVERVKVGFDSVATLSAGRVDAATAFWNAEGVTLRELGVRTREFRVDELGAPAYPELLLVSSRSLAGDEPRLARSVAAATAAGHLRVERDPASGLDHLLDAVVGLEREQQSAQLEALLAADAFRPLGARAFLRLARVAGEGFELPIAIEDLARLRRFQERNG